jgi:tryptophan synthase beta chain
MDVKITLDEKSIPGEWYNIIPDLPFDLPPATSPRTGYPIGPHDLEDLFPQPAIEQELDTKRRTVRIPDAVREIYRLWRPTPLFRAERFEKMLGTPARIFYKYEGVSPSGSHDLNTAVPIAYYSKEEKMKRIVSGTAAGEWGIALAMACKFFGINCKVFMAKAGFDQNPYGRTMMGLWGAQVIPSPSSQTKAGQKALSANPRNPGSLGLAISEAVWEAMSDADAKYALGTVMNHVLLHQTVIGLEAKKQMARAETKPDIVIGCVGGGSNFAGLSFPFMQDQLKRPLPRFIAAEPAAAPSLTAGKYAYDYPDTDGLLPVLKMHTLGHDFVPAHIRAGAMRYHGMSPLVSALYDHKIMEAVAYPQDTVLEVAIQFAHCEGILPAPESAYAIKAVVQEALACKAAKEDKTILFALNAHGYFDLDAYESHLAGRLEDTGSPIDDITAALTRLPTVQTQAQK